MVRPIFYDPSGQRQRWSRRSLLGILIALILASAIFATSALYEIIEWAVAVIVSPAAALAYLGTQGDPFDAQKDSALAMVGAIIALPIAAMFAKWTRKNRSTAKT